MSTAGAQLQTESLSPAAQVPELASRSAADQSKLKKRKEGRHIDRIKSEAWVFPSNFVREQLHASAKELLVVEAEGDAMAPTIMNGSAPLVMASGRGVSGGSCERSSLQAKKRTNGRRLCYPRRRQAAQREGGAVLTPLHDRV